MNFFDRIWRKQRLTEQDVVQAYRELLNREPESAEAVQAHLRHINRAKLYKSIRNSAEFKSLAGSTIPNRSRVAFVGNCQVVPMAQLCNAMNPSLEAIAFELQPSTMQRITSPKSNAEWVEWDTFDCVWAHPNHEFQIWLDQQPENLRQKVRTIPTIDTLGFHPDCVYASANGKGLTGPMGPYHSALVLWAWTQHLTPEQAIALFHDEVYEYLGYHDYAAEGELALLRRGQQACMPMDQWLAEWRTRGCWMHTINHPQLHVLADVVRHCLQVMGHTPAPDTTHVVDDVLARSPVWPHYPELAARLGLPGGYHFRPTRATRETASQPMDLAAFVQASYAALERTGSREIECARLGSTPFKGLAAWLKQRGPSAPAPATPPAPPNPYAPLPNHQFWRRSIEKVAPTDVDPVVTARFAITPTDKVATAGSCFAQHIARTLTASGFNYFVTETASNLPPDEQLQRNYGVFSARFGNVYTARQLLQLQRLALGHDHAPADLVLLREDGRHVDALRPYIEPAGFDSPQAVQASRDVMLHNVKRMLAECDVFVFTLGLTEAWYHRHNGMVFPIAPGVVTPHAQRADFDFVNFGVDDTVQDMTAFLLNLRTINPKVRVVLTVSPVPLMATYEPRSVLASTTYSKSVLRVAAQTLADRFAWVDYFPSYEVITGNFNRGRYFDDDLRSVTPEGVAHVMRLFMRHYAGQGVADTAAQSPAAPRQPETSAIDETRSREMQSEGDAVSAVICDEERLDGAEK